MGKYKTADSSLLHVVVHAAALVYTRRQANNGSALDNLVHNPPFHTSTTIRIIPRFRHSHGQVNPDSIRIETRIADPGGRVGFAIRVHDPLRLTGS